MTQVRVRAGIAGRRMFPSQRIFHLSTEPGDRELVYIVWVLETAGRLTLVDTGFPQRVADAHGISDHVTTAELLRRMGIEMGDVDDVIVSHFHYDHFAAPGAFPRATFHVQRQEVEYFLGRGRHHPVSILADEESLAEVPGLISTGRMNLLDGGATDLDGLIAMHVGGHTPGSQITVLQTGRGPLVLACDASHTYDNLGTRTPAGSIHNYDECQRAFTTVSTLARGGTWFPGHDGRILDHLSPLGDSVYEVVLP
jgi:glyoxylase-like metal-dependent hydrolase (beta-lactamase superfamily II)